MDAVGGRGHQAEHGCANVAAHLDGLARHGEQMGDQRRGGGLAVGAGDGDEGRFGRKPCPLDAEQLDIADDLDAGGAGALHRPVRPGMGQRHAGREHQRVEILPVGGAQVGGAQAIARGDTDRAFIIIKADDLAAAIAQGKGGGRARVAEAEHGNGLADKGCDGGHGQLNAA